MNTVNHNIYSIGKRWQYRYEPALEDEYLLSDAYTGLQCAIKQSIMQLLIQIEDGLSIEEIAIRNGIPEYDIFSIINRLNSSWEGLISPGATGNGVTYSRVNLQNSYNQFQLQYPKSVEIQITDRCNLACKHCIVSCDSSQKTRCIEPSSWIQCLQELDYNRVFNVTLTGGELLTYDGIEEVLSLLRQTKIHCNVLSNGMLVNDQIAELLSSPNIAASISMDGVTATSHDFLRGKGAFFHLEKGLEKLLRHGVRVGLSVTVHAKNHTEIEEIAAYAARTGCRAIAFILLDHSGRAALNPELHITSLERRNISKRIQELKDKYRGKIAIHHLDPMAGLSERCVDYSMDSIVSCTGAVSHVAISPNGDIYPCAFAFGMDSFCSGNITEMTVKKAWETTKWDMMRGKTHYRDLTTCPSCSFRKVCGNQSCRIRALLHSGDYYGVPSCACSRQ